MAKKESEIPSSVVVSRFSHWPTWLKLPSKKWLTITILIVGVLIVGGGAGTWLFMKNYNHQYWWAKLTHGQPIVFKVGNTAYTKTEVNQLDAYLTQVTKLSPTVAAQALFNNLKTQAAAQAAGVQPTSDEITQALSQLGYNNPRAQAYTYPQLAAFALAASGAAQRMSQGGQYSGYSFVFLFGQHMSPNLLDMNTKFVADPTLIAADRSYAQQQAQKYQTALASKQMTPDQVLAAVRADDRLAAFYTPGANPSIQFGTASNPYWKTSVTLASIVSFINAQTKPGLSSIRTGKSLAGALGKQTNVDTYYYFVLLTAAHPSNSSNIYTNYQHNLKSLKSKFYGI